MNRRPTSAVLLAAGRGERLRPHTDRTPKSLLAVAGRPTLDFVLCAVRRAGIQRVCLVTHHLEEQIRAYVGDGAAWGLQADFCHQPALDGSGGALRSVLQNRSEWIQRDEPLLVTATDYLFAPDALAALVDFHAAGQRDISISLKACPLEEISSRSSVALGEDWRVLRIIEKPAPGTAPSPYTAALVSILPAAVWDTLPRLAPSPRGDYDLQECINLLLAGGFTAGGLLQVAPGEWGGELV